MVPSTKLVQREVFIINCVALSKYEKLFVVTELPKDPWIGHLADILGILGFITSLVAAIFSILTKSEISRLKTGILFDKRIPKHIIRLKEFRELLNSYLNDYDQNINDIKLSLGGLSVELQDIKGKLTWGQRRKVSSLDKLIKFRTWMPFVTARRPTGAFQQHLYRCTIGLVRTDFDNIYFIYTKTANLINHLENIQKNKKAAP